MTGPPEPHFNMCTTSQDSHLVQIGTQSQFGVEWVVFFGQNIKFFYFLAGSRHAEGRTIRYQYPCFNDFGYCIVEKYRYIRYIVYRYTSLNKNNSKIAFLFCNIYKLILKKFVNFQLQPPLPFQIPPGRILTDTNPTIALLKCHPCSFSWFKPYLLHNE